MGRVTLPYSILTPSNADQEPGPCACRGRVSGGLQTWPLPVSVSTVSLGRSVAAHLPSTAGSFQGPVGERPSSCGLPRRLPVCLPSALNLDNVAGTKGWTEPSREQARPADAPAVASESRRAEGFNSQAWPATHSLASHRRPPGNGSQT